MTEASVIPDNVYGDGVFGIEGSRTTMAFSDAILGAIDLGTGEIDLSDDEVIAGDAASALILTTTSINTLF